MTKSFPYRGSLMRALADPVEALAYLNSALDDSQRAFLKALKNVARAHQMSRVAKSSGIQRETLYRSISDEGNPTFGTLSFVLGALEMKLSVVPEDARASQGDRRGA